MRRTLIILWGLSAVFLFSQPVGAASPVVTIVQPIRSRAQWDDLTSFDWQLKLIHDHSLPSTWLLQYSVLFDPQVLSRLHAVSSDQELGVFLEVDDRLATAAQVPYIFGQGDWARADKVLLSGYEPSERKRMIDELFSRFHKEFGYYPSSVGAWYIDAVSQQYLSDRYHIAAIMDCADQYVTDGYGLWGKPWGTPFYPSKYNGLVPAQSAQSFLPLVKIQWAPRDPVLGYGTTVSDSTYSVQANDYPRHGLDVSYFDKLLQTYLFTPPAAGLTESPLTQLTVGIEVGQEGKGFAQGYADQITLIQRYVGAGKVTPMTMSSFSREFQNRYPKKNPSFFISGSDFRTPETMAYWYSGDRYRAGIFLHEGILQIRDLRWYDDHLLFSDSVKKDETYPLRRIIAPVYDRAVVQNAMTVFSGVRSMTTRQNDQVVTLVIETEDSKTHHLLLKPDALNIDDQVLVAPQSRSRWSSFQREMKQWLFAASAWIPHVWFGDIRFASINGARYAGLWVAPDRLFGVSTARPYIGVFPFPFQVLTRFRTLPHIHLFDWPAMYLISKQ